MAEDRFVLTRDGYETLQRELNELEALYQRQLADFADVNDDEPANEEGAYFDRRVIKERTEERVGHLRLVLEHAEVVDEDPDPTRIDPGDRVTVMDVGTREVSQFDLLGGEEVVIGQEGISIDSPVGKALIGRREGDVVEVAVPDGQVKYAIRKIERIPKKEAK